MIYVFLVLIIGAVSILVGGSHRVEFTFPPGGNVGYETWLAVVVAASALGGAVLMWLAELSLAWSARRRIRKLEGMVRKAKESLAEKDQTIARYEEQLLALGALEGAQTPTEERAEPTEEVSVAQAAGATAEEETG